MHGKCGRVSEIADKLPKFDFPRSFAGPHFAINLKAAKSVSMLELHRTQGANPLVEVRGDARGLGEPEVGLPSVEIRTL
jgi:hypothetical protein